MTPFALDCTVAAMGGYLLGATAFGAAGGVFCALLALTVVVCAR